MPQKTVSNSPYTVATLIFALIFILAISIIATQGGFVRSSTKSDMQITAIYPNTATKNELDEYVAITNSGTRSIDLCGWSLTDNEGRIIFPSFSLAPDQTVYVTRTASVFVAQMRSSTGKAIIPDFEYGSDSDPKVRQLQAEGSFALRNSGDEVILQDKSGGTVDVIIYGDSEYKCEGWQGEPLKSSREGMVYKRGGVSDAGQSEDWILLPLGASYSPPEIIHAFGEVTAFVSPDCSFSILQSELDNASSSLYINLYQFENPFLMDLVLDALDRGVGVFLLLESSPIGGIHDEELYIAAKIRARGGEVRFANDPFINHAKYVVIDRETTMIMTENWKKTGIPYDNTFGNRGWGIVIRDQAVANYFKAVFIDDFQRGKLDLQEGLEIESISRDILKSAYIPVFTPLTLNCNFTLLPVLAPDTAMSNETILGAIDEAKASILVQQFSTSRFWADADNPFIFALIEAARRGCEVKVLLDSKYLDGNNNNDEVISWLRQVAEAEDLDLKAELADLNRLGLVKIHNKGLIVDDRKVIITSLNWNANSIHNRETGVIIENAEIASYFTAAFFHDWNVSVKEDGEESNLKIVWVILTLLFSFTIFWVVKWYKRI
ncbi:Phosphatidylserine/phosphatidylglycerophosphate/cardiolipin synthase [Methanophagales archaeon]|nr:Phosphatidylserine/phosphatidylglycerophosphate/cardiolipin synthase [Methanophagales archaeon]